MTRHRRPELSRHRGLSLSAILLSNEVYDHGKMDKYHAHTQNRTETTLRSSRDNKVGASA